MRPFVAVLAAGLLAACGGPAPEGEQPARPLVSISVGQVGALLSPEAKAAADSYQRDLRAGISAYVAEFGRFPQSFAELRSAAALRATAVSLIADGLGEQVPFASRETLEKAANAFVAAAETRVLDQMKAQHDQRP